VPKRVLLPGLALGAGALLAVHLLLYDTYWNYSEGVYALSAHLIVHGGGLYGGIVGAQPPGVFLAGAGLLAIHDGLEWLRLGVACLQLAAGLIAGQIVFRVTGNRLASVLTPAAMLLTPWAVHEHGALTPEVVALPVLLGAALMSAEERRAPLAGVLCGLLPLIKLPFALPAVVLVVLSADARRTAVWAAATLGLGLGVTTLAAGAGFWRDAVVAQTQTGARSLGALKGFWGQAAWNVVGLAVCAAAAVWQRARSRDQRLLRTTIGLAVAVLITLVTNVKAGTSLNVAVPVEAALLPLAACGTVFAFRLARARIHLPRSQWIAGACGAGLLFTAAQSASLIASPHDPVPFLRAGSRPAWEIVMSAPQLRAAVAAARSCPAGEPYGGPPLVAFMANREVPGGQPDQFITTHAAVLRSVRDRIAAAKPVCG
jgi:hypothetical protein